MIDWATVRGFDWDDGNARKSTDKHRVTQVEAEQVFFNQPLLVVPDQVFFNQPLLVVPDQQHSGFEQSHHALGVTDDERRLHISFTLRAYSGQPDPCYLRQGYAPQRENHP